MPRPRKDSTELCARARIKQAFWDLYITRPLEQIYVKEICAAAQCNKTTFYYHFENTAQILKEIEQNCMLISAPSLIVKLFTTEDSYLSLSSYLEENTENISRIRILLGPNGDPTFKDYLENTLIECWCSAIGISPTALSNEDELFLRWAMGGIMTIAASDDPDNNPIDYEAMYCIAKEVTLPRLNAIIEKHCPNAQGSNVDNFRW